MRTHLRSVSDGFCLLAVVLLAACGVYSFTRVADAAPVPKSIKEKDYPCTDGYCNCTTVSYYGVKKKNSLLPDVAYEFTSKTGTVYNTAESAIDGIARCETGSLTNVNNDLFLSPMSPGEPSDAKMLSVSPTYRSG